MAIYDLNDRDYKILKFQSLFIYKNSTDNEIYINNIHPLNIKRVILYEIKEYNKKLLTSNP